MTVYTRFGGKQQLLASTYRQGFDRLGATLTDAARTSGDPLRVLAEIGRAYRQAALASPTLYSLMFGPPIPGFEPSPETLRQPGPPTDPWSMPSADASTRSC